MFSLLKIVETAFYIYYWMIIVYILMSWAPQMRQTQVGELLGKIVEPYLQIFRRFIPPIGMIDISPIVALISLSIIEIGVKTLIKMLGGIL